MTNQEQIDSLSKLFQIIKVDNSKGRLETTVIVKDKRGFKDSIQYYDYTLEVCNHSLYYSVISELSKTSDFNQVEIQSVKFLKPTFFDRLFSNKRKKRLSKKISEMMNETSWVIIPSFLSQSFVDFPNFQGNSIKEDKMYIGYFDRTFVYVNPNISSKQLIFGNYDSFKIIVNSNNLDYCLTEKNNLKVLNII